MPSEPSEPVVSSDPASDPPDATPAEAEDDGAPRVTAATAGRHDLTTMKWGLIDFLLIGPIVLKGIYGLVGIPLGQALTLNRHPLRAALLRGSLSALILTGAGVRHGSISLLLALLVPMPYLMLLDPCYFFGGRRYGRTLINYLGRNDPRWHRRLAKGERIFARHAGLAVFFAAPLWFIPADVVYFLAGETGMSFRKFILLDFTGTLLFVAQVIGLGYFIGQPAEDLAAALSKYTWYIVVGSLLVVFALSLPGAVRKAKADEARRAGAQPKDEAE